MNLAELRQELDHARRTLFPDGIQGEVLPFVTRIRGSAGDWHGIAYSALTESDADRVIAEQVQHYRGLGVELEWTAYTHDSPPDLRQRLVRHGFEVGPCETVVVLDLEQQPAWLGEPPRASVVRVCDAGQVGIFRSLSERIFDGHHERVANELLRALAAGSEQHLGFISYDGGVPAGIGRLYTHPQSPLAGLYGGGTLPAHRGRGLYRANVAARGRAARALGARYLRVDALPTSRPILERLGFVHLTQTWPCILR